MSFTACVTSTTESPFNTPSLKSSKNSIFIAYSFSSLVFVSLVSVHHSTVASERLYEIGMHTLSATQRAAGGQIPASGAPLPPLDALPSLGFYPHRLDDPRPLLRFRLDVGGEFSRRAGNHLQSFGGQLFLHFRCADGAGDLLVQAIADRTRRSGRSPVAEPLRGVIS